MKEINKIQLNTEEYTIEPPIANETIQGGILAKQKTNESVPVKIRDGKCFIPEYPNGDNKIDIAQSAQNKDKVMVVNNSGELEATEYKASNDNTLFGHVDKQEIYTINDGFGGSFKNLIVNGKTIQKIETDVVPTPERPIPINSRKTTITKVNPNIFNLEKESDTSKIPDSGTYRSIGQYQLKPNTKYVFSWSGATVPAKATISFQIQDDKGTVLVSPFTYFNLEATEKKEAGKEVEFTTNSSGIVKFAYNCTVASSNTTETYQQYWYTKILKDITLKEDVEYEPEVVELRSLKESVNIWDNTNIASYDGEAIVFKNWAKEITNLETSFIELKPNTKYTVKMDIEMVEAIEDEMLTQFSLSKKMMLFRSSTNEFGLPAVNTNLGEYSSIMINGEVQSISATITTPEDLRGVSILGYTERWLDDSNKAYFANVKFKNIMLVEGNSAPSSYVAPTVRDYKIVDHTNKTAKIVRNIGLFECDFSIVTSKPQSGDIGTYRYDFKLSTVGSTNSSRGIIGFSETAVDIRADASPTEHFYCNGGLIVFWSYISNLKIKSNVVAPLKTPTEESIAYVETDTSEVGYSWQDTTSPSPTIKSEVKPVEKIDILKTGKNLFDIEGHEFTTNLQSGKTDNNRIVKVNNTTLRIQNPNVNNYAVGDKFVVKANEPLIISFDILEITGTEQINVVFYKETGSLLKSLEYRTIKVGTRFVIDTPITTRNNYVYIGFQSVGAGSIVTISNILLEHASIATAYEPYAEQRVNITPPQPLYQNDVINVESGEYEYNDITYVLDDKTFKGIQLASTREKTQVFQLNVNDLFNNNNIWCDKLKNDRNKDEELFIYKDGTLYISIYKNRLETVDVAGFKKWLKDNPLTFVGSSSSPTTQPIPEEDLAKLKSLKTEQGVTNIFSNVPLTFDYEQSVQIVIDNIKKQINSTNANILIGG